MLKKTSQFSGKAKPNSQHLNPSESFCWVSLRLLLGFLGFIVGFPYVYRLDKEKAIEDFRQAAELFRQQGNAPAREKALQFLRQLGAV
jgi:hypothetical protein